MVVILKKKVDFEHKFFLYLSLNNEYIGRSLYLSKLKDRRKPDQWLNVSRFHRILIHTYVCCFYLFRVQYPVQVSQWRSWAHGWCVQSLVTWKRVSFLKLFARKQTLTMPPQMASLKTMRATIMWYVRFIVLFYFLLMNNPSLICIFIVLLHRCLDTNLQLE